MQVLLKSFRKLGKYMIYDTDIAKEIFNINNKNDIKPNDIQHEEKNGVNIFRAICANADLSMSKYTTLDFPHFSNINQKSSSYIKLLADEIKTLIPKAGTVLVVGIGNPYLVADALGPKTLTGLFVTGHLTPQNKKELDLRDVFAFPTGVEHSTGINTNKLLKSVVDLIKPCCVICIDSLCTSESKRLGVTVQVSDKGLCSIGKTAINKELLGVDVIGIGVPTVMRLKQDPSLSITPKDIDVIIKRASALLALGLNCALQPALTLQEICLLTS